MSKLDKYTDGEDVEDEESNDSVSEDDSSDGMEDDTGILEVEADGPVWSGQQLLFLGPLKDRWFEGTSEEQKTIVNDAVKELIKSQPQDKKMLQRKLRRWLKRRTNKRKQYGPGTRPSFQTVIGYYMDTEITNAVYQEHGVHPGDKAKRFVGFYKTALSKIQRDILENPSRKDDRLKMEEARTRWMQNGPPAERKRKMAEKNVGKIVGKFISKLYADTGARCVVNVGYRNTSNDVCVSNFDFNNQVGKDKKPFLSRSKNVVHPYQRAWGMYLKKNLTDDEGGNASETDSDVEGHQIRVGLRGRPKPDVIFEKSLEGYPILPSDCIKEKLEDKKHIIRCFLKAHYAIAKGVEYPGAGTIPPWTRISEMPHSFFDIASIPVGVNIRDPSRMTLTPINKLLRCWLDGKTDDNEVFLFHHVWNESEEQFEEALKPEVLDESDEVLKPKKKRRRQKKGRATAKDEKLIPVEPKDDVPVTTGLTDRQKKGKAKATDAMLTPAETTENMPIHTDVNDSHPVTCNPTEWLELVDRQLDGGPNTFRDPGPSVQPHLPLSLLDSQIDPTLTEAYATAGPNDPVPPGCHAIPPTLVTPTVQAPSMPTDQQTELQALKQRLQQMEQMIRMGQPQITYPAGGETVNGPMLSLDPPHISPVERIVKIKAEPDLSESKPSRKRKAMEVDVTLQRVTRSRTMKQKSLDEGNLPSKPRPQPRKLGKSKLCSQQSHDTFDLKGRRKQF